MSYDDRAERIKKYRENLQRAINGLSDLSIGAKSKVDSEDPDADVIHAISRHSGQALQELDEAVDKLEERLVELQDLAD
jgi:hypothetical protein